MAHEELKQILRQMKESTKAEDVFGIPDQPDQQILSAEIKKSYMRMLQLADPDFYLQEPEAKLLAQEALPILNRFYEEAKAKINSGSYGASSVPGATSSAGELTITSGNRVYRIEKVLAQGDLSTVYSGTCTENGEITKIAAKLVEDPADNDLIQNEVRVLKLLNTEPGVYIKHIPFYMDEFRTQDGKAGLITKFLEGFDLNAIREKYNKGIPPRHIIWIFRRTLSIIGYAHSKGIIHGNIEPAHILVSPSDHNVFLIDWAYSIYKPASTSQGFRAVNEKFSAPEVQERKPPVPSSDLYSIGKCMVYLLGGNLATGEMPAEVDERVQRFIKFFIRESAVQRPRDAWEMYNKLDELRQEVYGPHQFIEFSMQ